MFKTSNGPTSQARRQGGAMVRTPPPPHRPKRSAWKEPKTKEKNAKDEPFLLICQRTCRKNTRGCWTLITVHVIDQYLSRPISGPNTIMRKGRLAVVFLLGLWDTEIRFRLRFFFFFTSYLNMQASIACVLGLVTCHLNQSNMATSAGQSCCFEQLVLNDWNTTTKREFSWKKIIRKEVCFREFAVYKATPYLVEWN